MKYELSQKFYFDAAHQLKTEVDAESNAVIHGHTYYAEIYLHGELNEETGMVMDMGIIKTHTENLRKILDHKFLNNVPNLGIPTMENLTKFINAFFNSNGIKLAKVSVWRKGAGNRCTLYLE